MTPDPTRIPDGESAAARVRCPTCGAEQEWSDTCRRCKCDLRLLRAFAAAYRCSRSVCLEHLRQGQGRAAMAAARRCHELRPGTESRRLLALASLECGDWEIAAALARRILV